MESNAFQERDPATQEVQRQALEEFNQMVRLLRAHHLKVNVIEDSLKPHTPDSIFPNNWVSFHEDGTIFLYPMEAPNRRQERRPEIIEELKRHYQIHQIIDLSGYENDHKFLEGTGSLVLDRGNKIAYTCLSTRTQPEVLEVFANKSGYRVIDFEAYDDSGIPIYHTNVMMCVAENFAVLCAEAVTDKRQRETLLNELEKSKKDIIEISLDQMKQFAGNMLEVMNADGERFLVMSESAYLSLDEKQKNQIEIYCQILHAPLSTIEKNGGGSARCMMAEIFLQPKQ